MMPAGSARYNDSTTADIDSCAVAVQVAPAVAVQVETNTSAVQVTRLFFTWMMDSLSVPMQVAKPVFTWKLGAAAVGRCKLESVSKATFFSDHAGMLSLLLVPLSKLRLLPLYHSCRYTSGILSATGGGRVGSRR
jgi:hypothetical protein